MLVVYAPFVGELSVIWHLLCTVFLQKVSCSGVSYAVANTKNPMKINSQLPPLANKEISHCQTAFQ